MTNYVPCCNLSDTFPLERSNYLQYSYILDNEKLVQYLRFSFDKDFQEHLHVVTQGNQFGFCNFGL